MLCIVALAGLPGTGKSSLARALAPRLGAVVLDKDRFRAALFGDAVDYSREQDDAACRAMHAAVEALGAAGGANVLLDGRTYSKRHQVDELRALAGRVGARLVLIECTAPEAVVRERLEHDLRVGRHPARNRDFELYVALRAAADPLDGAEFVLDTSSAQPEELAQRVVERLEEPAS